MTISLLDLVRKYTLAFSAGVIFFIITTCSCTNYSQQATHSNQDDTFRLVSNTHGAIKRIIISSGGPSDSSYVFIKGLKKVIDSIYIVAIHKTIIVNKKTLKKLAEYNKTSPLTLNEVLTSYMGDSLFNEFKIKYGDLLNLNKAENKNINDLPDSIATEIENDIKIKVAQYTTIQLFPLFKERTKEIKTITTLDDTDYTTLPELDFWVQDQFHALQKFTHPNSIKLIYSTENTIYSSSVARIIDSLPFIKTDSVNYIEFGGGNFLPTDNYLLIGQNTLYLNKKRSSRSSSISNYKRTFDNGLRKIFNIPQETKIIHVGFDRAVEIPGKKGETPSYQPLFHIDLFFTPAGKRGTKDLIYIGQIHENAYSKNYLNSGKPYLNSSRLKIVRELNALIKETANSILKDYDNFVFDTLPLVIKFGKLELDTNFIQLHPSFNNAIIEITQKSKKAILPDYVDSSYVNFNYLKEKAKAKFESDSFKVFFIAPPVDKMNKGAIHCYTKVIWREKY